MIKIEIACDGKEVYDKFEEDKPTLKEVALVLLRLKQIEQSLIDKEFESDFEVSEDLED